MKINERVKSIRKHFNFNQTEFAKQLGVKQAKLSAVEIGTVNITLSLMQTLISKYSININWLLTGKGKMFIDEGDSINLNDIILRLKEYQKIIDNN